MKKSKYLSMIKTYLKYVGLHSKHLLLPYKEMSKDQLHAVVGLLHLVKTETLLKGEKQDEGYKNTYS